MVWIVTGAQGQLGTALTQMASTSGLEVAPLSHRQLDITHTEEVDDCFQSLKPEGVINTAAYNFVDRAEDHPLDAIELNAGGPMVLAAACNARRIPLVQVSTDFVFSGTSEVPYREEDPPAPLGAYGRSKWKGEQGVRDHAPRHFIVRTCGVYGKAASVGKGNFVETILRLAAERDELQIVHDQRCTPTSAKELARGIFSLIQTDSFGTYHLTCQGDCSWYEFAVEILRQSGIPTPVKPISSSEFGAKAKRPPYSVLNCDKLAAATGFRAVPWREALVEYLAGR